MTGRRSEPLASLVFTSAFLAELLGPAFTRVERKKIQKALALLDANERHPSLEVHQLSGREGEWAAKADEALRLVFRRLPEGRKLLLGCTHYYRD